MRAIEIYQALGKLSSALRLVPTGQGYAGICPSCTTGLGDPFDALTYSFSISQFSDGEAVAKCWAGCSDEKLVKDLLLFCPGIAPTTERQYLERELGRGHDRAYLQARLDKALALPIKEKPRSMSFSELMAKPYPERNLLFGSFLREASLGEVYAKRGQGKSWFTGSLAYAVATGGEFLGMHAKRACGVLVVDGELDPHDFKRRLLDIHRLSGEAEFPEKLRFLLKLDPELGWDADLSTKEGQAIIEAELEGIELLILDNLSCLCPKVDENDALSWEPMNSWLLSLRRRGVAVQFVHHAGKGGQQRGTSKREDSLDYVIALQEPENRKQEGAAFVVSWEKNRVGPKPATFEAELISTGAEEQELPSHWERRLATQKTSAPLSKLQQEIARRLRAGQPSAQICADLNTTKGTISKVRKKLTPEIDDTPSQEVSTVSSPKGERKPGNLPSGVGLGNQTHEKPIRKPVETVETSSHSEEIQEETTRKPTPVSLPVVGFPLLPSSIEPRKPPLSNPRSIPPLSAFNSVVAQEGQPLPVPLMLDDDEIEVEIGN